jgi:hypothetical protein
LVDAVYQEEELTRMSNSKLKAPCKAKGVVQSGNKRALIEHLKLNTYGTNDQLESIESLMLSCWLMPPVENEAMKLGTMNEHTILQNFPTIFEEHCTEELDVTPVESVKEYGLMHLNDHPYAAFSPDAIVTLRTPMGNDGTDNIISLVGVELKTRTNSTLDAIEKLLADTYGKFQEINLSREAIKFKQSIRELSYRCQILHCMACAGIQDWFYVTASLASVICVVLIHTNLLRLSVYRQSLTWLKDMYFPWVYDDSLPLPDFGNQYM